MEQLLKSCHASPSLNQFIESYLRMVQRLLETNSPAMERLATDLFVRFSMIEEGDAAPAYFRQYDFFISKFSAMCHAPQRAQRFNGLRGLRGVIFKSVGVDLQATSIWEPQHMNKIIPSILFNLEDEHAKEDDSNARKQAENTNKGVGGASTSDDDEDDGGRVMLDEMTATASMLLHHHNHLHQCADENMCK